MRDIKKEAEEFLDKKYFPHNVVFKWSDGGGAENVYLPTLLTDFAQSLQQTVTDEDFNTVYDFVKNGEWKLRKVFKYEIYDSYYSGYLDCLDKLSTKAEEEEIVITENSINTELDGAC